MKEKAKRSRIQQLDYYKKPPHLNCSHCRFFSSFYKVAVDMWEKGIDLTEKQFNIIKKEYSKVREKRYEEVMHSK